MKNNIEYAVVVKKNQFDLGSEVVLVTEDMVRAFNRRDFCNEHNKLAEVYQREVGEWQKVKEQG